MVDMTLEQIKAVLPKNSRKIVTQETVDILNNLTGADGEDFASTYRDNFLSYSKVLTSGEFKTDDYIYAVKYVSYKLMDHSNIDAYMMTFPERYARVMAKYAHTGTPEQIRDSKMSMYVSAYNKNMLVNRILEQTLIPTHVLNAPLYQQALNVQVGLMLTARSEMVRSTAANAVLIATKPPETSKIELDINVKESSAIADLREVTQKLAAQHQLSIRSGATTTKEIGATSLHVIDAEIDDD